MKIGHVYFTVHNTTIFFQNHDVHNPKCWQIVLIMPIGSMYAIFPCNWLILELDLALTLLHESFHFNFWNLNFRINCVI